MHALYALNQENAMADIKHLKYRPRRATLKRRETLVLDDAEGTIVAVDRGCLWVTLESDLRDVVLTRGMRFQIDRSGRTILAAEDDSSIRLLAPVTLVETARAWLNRSVARWFDGEAARLSRRAVPYL
jgi:hypothetical protein